MVEPSKSRKTYLNNLPSVYTKIDFTNDVVSIEDRVYWFQKNRVEKWLIKDTRSIFEKAESLFGLSAMIFIGIETLSGYAYVDNGTNSSERFKNFLWDYVDPSFKIIRKVQLDFNDNRKPITNPTDADIFYKGMRNSLMHSFSFRWVELSYLMSEFKRWEPNKMVLKIDARRLHIKFEDSIHKYFRNLWKANEGDAIYSNFDNTFSRCFVT